MSGRIAATAGGSPGEARVTIAGAAALASDTQLRIRREGWDAGVLGPQGWQTGDVLLRPLSRTVEGSDLVLVLGPEVTRHLERGVYMMSVPAARIEDEAVVWPDIVQPFGGTRMRPVRVDPVELGKTLPDRKTGGETRDIPVVVDPKPEPDDALQKRRRNRRMAIGAVVAAILLLVAAGVAYREWPKPPPVKKVVIVPPPNPVTRPPVKKTALEQPKQKTVVPVPTPPPAPVPPPVPPPVQPPSLASLSVNDAIAQAPNPDALFNEGERRLNGTQKDDGLLLLEAAADKGDAKAMLSLARLYDPVHFDPHGPIPQADPHESAEYYRQAVKAGSQEAVAPRAALHDYLQTKAQQGDLDAKFALQDFWP